MTVLEAMNLLGLNERPQGLATLELAMARAYEQTPRQHELLEEAGRCLAADLATRASDASHLPSFEDHQTREILLFDENRDAVMFGDDPPDLPVPFHASLVDDVHWMGDDSVIFEGELQMMSEFAAASSVLQAEAAETVSVASEAEPSLLSPPRSETSISGEWQLMLESLEAEGLIKPEEGFSDALSSPMYTAHDTPTERPAAPPPILGDDSQPIFAALEARGPGARPANSVLLETPLFAEPLFQSPLLELGRPSALETPLFAASPLDTSEQAKAVVTFDESLLISHGGSLADTADGSSSSLAQSLSPTTAEPSSAAPKTLETLPSRKASEAAQLSIKPAAAQPREPAAKQLTGRGSVAPRGDAAFERRTTTKPPAPRTYRDARESPTQVRRRRQPIAVWLLGVAALLGSAVFIAPNLAAQLRNQLLPRAAPSKPSAAAAVVKPQVRVVKPAAIKPPQSSLSPAKPVVAESKITQPRVVKPTVSQSSRSGQPTVSKPAVSQPTVTPSAVTVPARAAAPLTPPISTVAATPRVANIANTAATVRTASRVTATPSSASSLPPVTRPEGFASAAASKPAIKPVAAVKPVAAAVKPVLRPAPAPSPAPVASIEYQGRSATAAADAAEVLPGGLSRQEFGRQFLNRKQFEVWQGQQLTLRFESFAQIPVETQVLEAEAFRAAVLVPTVRPTRPERP